MANDYFNDLSLGSFEKDISEEIETKCKIPAPIEAFIERQRLLAKAVKFNFDAQAALHYILLGYQYGIRFERAAYRGDPVPDYMVQTLHPCKRGRPQPKKKRRFHTFADNGSQSFVPPEPLFPCALCGNDPDISMGSGKLKDGKLDVKIRCCNCGVNMCSDDLCADVLPTLMKGGKAARRIKPVVALVRAWNHREEVQA